MTLGEFHQLVSTCMKRGTALDAVIPAQVKLAVQWMERNYTMKYMETFRLLQVTSGDRIIQLPTNSVIKSIKMLRFVGEDSEYRYPIKCASEDLTGLRTTDSGTGEVPSSYYMVGTDTLVFGAVPGSALTGEAIFYEYTDWPTEESTRHPLLSMAADVLLAQTQLLMSVNILKDMRMAEGYKLTRDEAVNTLTRAEDETKYGGESVSMAYAPFNA